MPAERRSEPVSNSENTKQSLIEFMQGAFFGDVRYQAFFDWRANSELDGDISRITQEIKRGVTDPGTESRLRIMEFRKALLEHEIGQKEMTMPGYNATYTTIWGAFDSLGGQLHSEAEEKYPNNEEAIHQYVDNESSVFIEDLADSLYKRFS